MKTSVVISLVDEKRKEKEAITKKKMKMEEGENHPFGKARIKEKKKDQVEQWAPRPEEYNKKIHENNMRIEVLKKKTGGGEQEGDIRTRKRSNSMPERRTKRTMMRGIEELNIHEMIFTRSNNRKPVTPDEDTSMVHTYIEQKKILGRSSLIEQRGSIRKRSNSVPTITLNRSVKNYLNKKEHLKHLANVNVAMDQAEDAMLVNRRS
mmetsp:Transcript_13711/g.20770  ORF Transcript_13711/g.20770 Transcript_13711/m.20770 type:complete len:207 (+) Transcript_13711:48-668(+)